MQQIEKKLYVCENKLTIRKALQILKTLLQKVLIGWYYTIHEHYKSTAAPKEYMAHLPKRADTKSVTDKYTEKLE